MSGHRVPADVRCGNSSGQLLQFLLLLEGGCRCPKVLLLRRSRAPGSPVLLDLSLAWIRQQ